MSLSPKSLDPFLRLTYTSTAAPQNTSHASTTEHNPTKLGFDWNHNYSNLSSASRALVSVKRENFWMTSATVCSPCTLLSRVRTFTVELSRSFSPTTAHSHRHNSSEDKWSKFTSHICVPRNVLWSVQNHNQSCLIINYVAKLPYK